MMNNMRKNRLNLLPANRISVLIQDYFFRVGIVALVLSTVLVASAALLLVPTYSFSTTTLHTKEAYLSTIKSTQTSSNELALPVRVKQLSAAISVLTAVSSESSSSVTIRHVLAVSRPGAVLSGIAYDKDPKKKPGTVTITGMATTRDSLLNYQLALQNASFAQSVDLPVSSYAKDVDIPFTITVTLKP